MAQAQLYLASQSPRRYELLKQLGMIFEVLSVDIDESLVPNETATQAVQRLALDKAQAGQQHPKRILDLPILGSDTLVECANQILGKPANQQQAMQMLHLLSGQQHQVHSAIAMVSADGKKQVVNINSTVVYFRQLSNQEIECYWQTGEPEDKAGAYAIQGYGSIFVERIEGSFSGIVGLPLFETSQLLAEFDIAIL